MSSVLTYNGHGLKLMTGSGYVRVSGEKYDPVPKAEMVPIEASEINRR